MSERDDLPLPEGVMEFQLGQPSNAALYNLTLRDYFAAKALTQWWIDHADASRITKGAVSDTEVGIVAAFCYRLADAMLKEREK